MEQIIDKDLRDAHAELHPKFSIAREKLDPKINRAAISSTNRIQLAKHRGERHRVRELVEEIGILAYMRRNDIANDENRG